MELSTDDNINYYGIFPHSPSYNNLVKKNELDMFYPAKMLVCEDKNENFCQNIKKIETSTLNPIVYDMGTCIIIMFDIVNFTTMVELYDSITIGKILHYVYLEIDQLALQYNIIKVETVGDAYVACSCIFSNKKNNTQKQLYTIVENSLIFTCKVIENCKNFKNPVAKSNNIIIELRAGVSIGNVSAGIIGLRVLNPGIPGEYNLFGKPLCRAARIQQYAGKNNVCIDEDIYKLIYNNNLFIFSNPIIINPKGLPKMNIYKINLISKENKETEQYSFYSYYTYSIYNIYKVRNTLFLLYNKILKVYYYKQ